MLILQATLAACGDGDGGTQPPTDPTGVLTAPTFTAVRGAVASANLLLSTNLPAAGLQVDVVTQPEVIASIVGAASADRAGSLEVALQNVDSGLARVVLFSPSGSADIPAGNGAVVTLSFQLSATAPLGESPVELSGGLLVDEDAEPFDLTLEAGGVTVSAQ